MNPSLLMNTKFVAVFPELVKTLDGDLTAAAVLQDVHYRLQKEKDPDSGIQLSLQQIAEDIGISRDQAKRAAVRLKDAGLLVVYGNDKRGTTRTIGIDYEALDTMSEQSGAVAHHSKVEPQRATSETPAPQKWDADAPPNLYIRKEENKKTVHTSSNGPATELAQTWWESLTPKPVGRRAWFSLLNSLTQLLESGWQDDQILDALRSINKSSPSIVELENTLRNPRSESWSQKKAREDREHAEKAAAMRRALEEEDRQRRERIEREKAEACAMPDHVREQLAEMRKKRTA